MHLLISESGTSRGRVAPLKPKDGLSGPPAGLGSIPLELTQGLRPFGKLRAGSGLLSAAPLGLPSLRLRAEQAPGFAVALIAVAICLCLLHGTEREAFFA